MPITFQNNAVVAAPGQQYALSSLVSVTPGKLPEYLVLTGFDFDRYTAASAHSVGALTGAGKTQAMDSASPVFTYTDQGYYNSDLGYLNALNYVASADNNRSDYLSVYGYGSAGTPDAKQFGTLSGMTSALQFLYTGSSFLGSVDVVTRSNYIDATPNAATPSEIAAVAASFVGKVWSDQGCWVLTSNIATAAGASLPVSSAVTNDTMTPVANGEWIVAYDSTKASAAQQQSWQLLLRPGDVVDIAGFCANHITTVVSGTGFGAMTIDNRGVSAADGAPGDIVIDGPLNVLASLTGGFAKYVTIYRLDTPIVTPLAELALPAGATKPIAGLFSAADPGGKALLSYQLYDSGASAGSFVLGGVAHQAHGAASALTVAAVDLASVQFTAGATAGSDNIMVRAYNGSYWGDWQAINVLGGTAIQAPTVSVASGAVLVRAGEQVSLASLVSASSPDAAITTYTIHDPADGGHVMLNGAVNLLGGAVYPANYYVSYMSPDLSIARYPDATYQVSAQDFAKLSYVAGGVMDNADALTITTNNGTAQSSLPVDLSLLSVGMEADGISHYLAPGTTLAASALFALSGIDSNHPLHSYVVSVINPGPSSGTVNLNGAVNGVSASLVNAAGLYEVTPADFAKLTYTVGKDADLSGQTIAISALDTVSFTNTQLVIYNATAPALLSAKADQVAAGATVTLASLFDSQQPGAGLLFHIFDPQGGGAVNINDATNTLGKRAQLGEYAVTGADLAKMSYTGGTGGDTLLIAASGDFGLTWAPEIPVVVGGSPAPAAAPPEVVGFGPAAGGTEAVDGKLIVTFSAAIKLGGGTITLTDAAGQTVETYHAGSALLTISGNVLTIHPGSSLAPASSYRLDLGADAVEGMAGSLHANAASFGFSTTAASADVSQPPTVIQGGAGDDVLTGGQGRQQIDGGDGKDTVVYAGHLSDYTVAPGAAGIVVAGPGGSADTLSHVETLRFADASLTVSIDSAGLPAEAYRMYQAAFNRAPDLAGLGYWVHALAGGLQLGDMASVVVQSAEWVGLYSAGLSNAALVANLYSNILHRAPDAAGASFWTAALDTHAATLPQVLAAFSDSPENQAALVGVISHGIAYLPFGG